MGCQSEVYIGDSLTFTITTHDPETGESMDADAAPVYSVYEDETGAAILSGTMALLDAANTTGFYSEQIACTAANGFEDGKSYNVWISATVDSHPGAISYAFRARAKLLEDTLSRDDALRIMLAALAGKAGGGGSPNVYFRDVADAKNRIEAVVDANGNRTSIMLDGA